MYAQRNNAKKGQKKRIYKPFFREIFEKRVKKV